MQVAMVIFKAKRSTLAVIVMVMIVVINVDVDG